MTVEKRQLEYGETLRRLRQHAGYRTGRDFAEHIGWQPSKVSRLENGRTLPADRDVSEWLAAVGAPPEIADEVQDLLRELRLDRDSWKRQLRHGHADRQRAEAVSERDATTIIVVEWFVVPGLVQTADYARAVFELASRLHESPSDSDEAVLERIRRQDVLYDKEKHVEILLSEAALRNPVCPPDVLSAQFDRLTTLLGLPNVRLGIVPLDAPLPTVTLHGYAIHDHTVIVEVNHTEMIVTDADEVDLYRRITDGLWSVALEGDEARALLQRLQK